MGLFSNKSLYKVHFPFVLRSLKKLTATKEKEGRITYTVFLDQSVTMKAKVVKGRVVGNKLLDLYRLGKNPFYKYHFAKLIQLFNSQVGEKVDLCDSENTLRWSSAGGIVIISDASGSKYVPLNLRSSKGFNGNRIGDFTGMSNKYADWLFPQKLCYREMIEELIIINSGQLLFANNKWFSEKDQKKLIKHQLQISRLLLDLNKNLPVKKSLNFKHINFRNGLSRIRVLYSGKTYETKAFVHIDPPTASVELRYLFELKVENIKDLTFIDGETEIHKRGHPKNRRVYLFDFTKLIDLVSGRIDTTNPKAVFHDGRDIKNAGRIKVRCNNFTPTLLEALKAI